MVPDARATERMKNLSIIFLKFVESCNKSEDDCIINRKLYLKTWNYLLMAYVQFSILVFFIST
jgi:hypothetical protein